MGPVKKDWINPGSRRQQEVQEVLTGKLGREKKRESLTPGSSNKLNKKLLDALRISSWSGGEGGDGGDKAIWQLT